MTVRKGSFAALACCLSFGCKSSPTQVERPAPSASAALISRPKLAAGGWTSNKACLLLERADVVAALGEQGLRNVKRPEDGEQKDSPLVECTYNRGAEPGFVRLTIDVPSRHEAFGAGYPDPNIAGTSVPGIGDAAFQSENSSTGFILYVKKNDVTFWVQAQTSDKGPKDKALVRSIAKKAVDRL